MAIEENSESMRQFAEWIVGRVWPNEVRLIQQCLDMDGKHTSIPWAVIAQNHAKEFAGMTGGPNLSRQSHYEAAGQTVANMLNAGEIEYSPE